MNEMASPVMEIWTPVVGEMLELKREPTNIHDIHASGHLQRYRNYRPYSLQSSSKNVSILMRRTKRLQKSQEPKSTGELAMVWKSHVSTVYMDLNVYVDKMKELAESLHADGHYNLCSSDFAQ